jgi:hypothetical protein
MKKRIAIVFSVMMIGALLLSGGAILRSVLAGGDIHTHSVWTNDNPVSVRDGNTGCSYSSIEKWRSITSWSEEGPPLYPAIAHFRGFAVVHRGSILCGDHDFEFRLIDASNSTDKEVIDGTWDVYRDGSLVCSHAAAGHMI